jgi:hypothetical protein
VLYVCRLAQGAAAAPARRLLSAPHHASGCTKLRPASADQPLGLGLDKGRAPASPSLAIKSSAFSRSHASSASAAPAAEAGAYTGCRIARSAAVGDAPVAGLHRVAGHGSRPCAKAANASICSCGVQLPTRRVNWKFSVRPYKRRPLSQSPTTTRSAATYATNAPSPAVLPAAAPTEAEAAAEEELRLSCI